MAEMTGSSGVWVFAEIQDHERVFEGALELLSRGRELADTLNESLTAVILALDAEQYIPTVREYGPDAIIHASSPHLKHYHEWLYPKIIGDLADERKPSILLIPATEAGRDLAPRIARRFNTGMTAHCTGLDIIDHPDYGKGLLLMRRPAFNGDMIASIVCPHTRPQIATVQPGVFETVQCRHGDPLVQSVPCPPMPDDMPISQCQAPLRWDRPRVSLESSPVVVGGGRGMASESSFEKLYPLAALLEGEVGATRVPVFRGWCEEERMIGQTGRTIRPDLYIAFGISGQVQHTASVLESTLIVAVNNDPTAPIFGISDYAVIEDAPSFCEALIERIKTEKT